jgi:hypothetical protein
MYRWSEQQLSSSLYVTVRRTSEHIRYFRSGGRTDELRALLPSYRQGVTDATIEVLSGTRAYRVLHNRCTTFLLPDTSMRVKINDKRGEFDYTWSTKHAVQSLFDVEHYVSVSTSTETVEILI